jgi:hypothetical protein
MRTKIFIALCAVLFVAGAVFAGDNGNGCKPNGTWIGELPYPLPDDTPLDPTDNDYYMLKLFAEHSGAGDNEGSTVTEWINPVTDPGTSWSNQRGVWKKSGGKKYDFSKIGYIYNNSNGEITAIYRQDGSFILTDCDTMAVSAMVEISTYPDMIPVMCVPYEVTLKRVLLREPCQPQ